MKINFTPLLFVLGFIAAHSQITTSGNATMVVNAKTLVYSTGDITINSDGSKITNNGNIRIKEGTYKNKSTNKETGILELAYTDENNYGQLIINSTTPADGKIQMVRTIDGHSNSTGINQFVYFGSPFQDYEFDDLAKDLNVTKPAYDHCRTSGITEVANKGKGRVSYCSKWGKVPIFVWNNKEYRNDPDDGNASNKKFIPGLFYNIRKKTYSTSTNEDPFVKATFKGVPYVAGTGGLGAAIPFSKRDFKIGEGAKDVYNIYFYTYTSDPFVAAVEGAFTKNTTNQTIDDAHYSTNILQLVNPFTSNLDLKIATNNYTGIHGIGSYGAVTGEANVITRYTTNLAATTISNSGTLVGNVYLEIIPPMTNFFIKSETNTGGGAVAANFDLYNSKNQTFDSSNYKFPATNDVKSSRISSYSTDNIYQISLQLSNKTRDIVYNDTYVASGSEFKTATLQENEVYSSDSNGDRTNIYTLPEGKTGGADPALADLKLYINVINSNSDKVAIPVGIDIDKEDGSTFVITSELAENGKLLAKGMKSFDDPNAGFYFHDKKLGKSVLIDSNFKYEFTQVESTKDRFEIFWSKSKSNGGIGDEIVGGTEDAQALNGLTIIYKSDNDDYKVRFNKNWKKAEVSVFSILGQLISSEKNINTENDYLLPIKNISSSMFVVKITNEKGETVTKKIVK